MLQRDFLAALPCMSSLLFSFFRWPLGYHPRASRCALPGCLRAGLPYLARRHVLGLHLETTHRKPCTHGSPMGWARREASVVREYSSCGDMSRETRSQVREHQPELLFFLITRQSESLLWFRERPKCFFCKLEGRILRNEKRRPIAGTNL